MTYTVEFYKDGKLHHSKAWDLGLESAKQHASVMTARYGATSSRVLDKRGKEAFAYSPAEAAPSPASED